MVEIILKENEDWEKRTLCRDESCIGTIGQDGRCRECGKTYNSVVDSGNSAGKVATHEKQKIVSESEVSVTDDDWDKRILCSDEACIGTIGEDGRCRECGKPAK
jgi:hypothetical protein